MFLDVLSCFPHRGVVEVLLPSAENGVCLFDQHFCAQRAGPEDASQFRLALGKSFLGWFNSKVSFLSAAGFLLQHETEEVCPLLYGASGTFVPIEDEMMFLFDRLKKQLVLSFLFRVKKYHHVIGVP